MKICCIPTIVLPPDIVKITSEFRCSLFDYIKEQDICWIEREKAEKDTRYKQLIPYILVCNEKNEYACYPRHGTEKRLHGLYSCGVGGHIDETDNAGNIKQTIMNGMYRELGEEFKNFSHDSTSITYLGIINEVENDVGIVHLGIVYLLKCENGYIPLPAKELEGLEWKTIDKISTLKKELWSELAFKLLEE